MDREHKMKDFFIFLFFILWLRILHQIQCVTFKSSQYHSRTGDNGNSVVIDVLIRSARLRQAHVCTNESSESYADDNGMRMRLPLGRLCRSGFL